MGALPHFVSSHSIFRRDVIQGGRWRIAATDEAAANQIVCDEDGRPAVVVVSDQHASAYIVLQ
jgi:hypothetical protein